MDTRTKVEHFRLFSVFMDAGLVDTSSESSFPLRSRRVKTLFLLELNDLLVTR